MSVLIKWIAISTQILLISAASLPSCELSDSQCLTTTAQSALTTLTSGIPEIGAEVLDILNVKKIKVDLAGLKLTIRDAEIKGLRKATVDSVTVDANKKILKVMFHADILMKGKYKAAGQLLILPISGDGDMTFKLKKVEVQLFMPFEFKETDTGKIMDLKSFNLKYEVIDGAHFALTNLFNGNKELSDAMLTFMNSNWKVLTQEFGQPILDAAHKTIFDSIKKFVATQPLK